jgi:hypothetical protein
VKYHKNKSVFLIISNQPKFVITTKSKTKLMKKSLKLFAAISGLILFASACSQRTCPTYASEEVQKESTIEATV